MKNKLLILAVLAGLTLTAIPASADQVFLFSDDLSFYSDINRGQTGAKLVSGRFYTADDSVSSAVASEVVANPSKAIISARLDVDQNIPSGTRIIYYLSNNNGSRWTQVNTGFTYTFDSVGNELRWRAVITRESPVIASAYIDRVNITYIVSDSLTPSSVVNSLNNNNSPNTVIYGAGGDLTSFVCGALSSIGMGCGAPQRVVSRTYGPAAEVAVRVEPQRPVPAGTGSTTGNVGTGTLSNALQASIANVATKRTASDDEVILVKVPATNGYKQTLGLQTNDAIFEIIRGQKHFIPTVDIFFDYGFDLAAVQSVTYKDLEPFPRAKLTKVQGDSKKSYYITEGHMIRLIPNKRVFESYGDKEEDVITISKKEFNFYPRNQYVFLENPSSADIYQVVNDGTKRFIVPQVVKRLRIRQDQVAPINKQQLDSYDNGQPLIF
ncbi:MAG: hypothetical protein A3D52_00325 [Candidatus Taylorbacteria bacterium RIFCSPHIGHO2_02_FULL_44_36]|nr:MAG: hypothetical protein A3D52_00325 [Candidatus Taylorbacteria bacterium RIFCSPHIGHO2_02_FULL_44_36]HXK40649.1 hypothetical protein [Candidatus Paceibacterota bacterium]